MSQSSRGNVALPDFGRSVITVVGDVMLDQYWHGSTARISPEAPVPVVRVDETELRAGGAANVAVNLAALGARVRLVGVVGDDDHADALRTLLIDSGVEPDFVIDSPGRTITKLRAVSRHQQLLRLDFESPVSSAAAKLVRRKLGDALSDCQAVLLSDYAKGALTLASEMIADANAAGVAVSVDPKGASFERYAGASALTPNMGEFELVVGHCGSEAELERRARSLRRQLGLRALVVTRGEHGMSLITDDDAIEHLPARAREVFDVTGAGDTVIAVLAAARAAGSSWQLATALANAAAGLVVGRLGTAVVTAAELSSAGVVPLVSPEPGDVPDRAKVLAMVSEARSLGQRIVMTNGCFDVLHAGHVQYLRAARAEGDCLLVAVNDDASVSRLKGEGRPINPLADRMMVLGGLEGVDWVVPFPEDTPAELIRSVTPDVLVKGGDYRIEEIAGADHVLANGGEVKVLDYLEGRSTSRIVERLRDSSRGS